MFFSWSRESLNKRYWRAHGLQQAHEEMNSGDWQQISEGFAQQIHSHLRGGMRVIELGCSGGHWYERLELRDRGCHYTGVEWNPDSVALAAKRFPEAEFRCADITKVTDLDRFDYVFTCQVPFFLDQPSLELILSRLRSGALITIAEPSQHDIDSYVVSRAKRRKNAELHKIVYRHPFPLIFEKMGYEILSRQLAEQVPGKVKLLMTGRRK
jgi:trans-aconitate methyltransferase